MERKPTHPGEIFLKDVLEPLNINITDGAKILGISRKTLSDFVNEKIALSSELAYRIAIATNTSYESWMLMQLKLTMWNTMQHEPAGVQVGVLEVR